MSKIRSSQTKLDVEKFNVKENFDLWENRVKALLVQHGLHKTLQRKSAKPAGMTDENWETMDLKAASMIQLCLAGKLMYNMIDEETTTSFKVKNMIYDKEPLQQIVS